MCTFQLCWNDQRKLSEPSSFLLGGNTPCMNCEFIWRNAVCWEKSRAPFLSHHWNKPHRSSFLTQRSWLAPSRICFTILAFSQHRAPLCLCSQESSSSQPEHTGQALRGSPSPGSPPAHAGSASCLPRWPSPDKDSFVSRAPRFVFPNQKTCQCQHLTLPSTGKLLEDIMLLKVNIKCC